MRWSVSSTRSVVATSSGESVAGASAAASSGAPEGAEWWGSTGDSTADPGLAASDVLLELSGFLAYFAIFGALLVAAIAGQEEAEFASWPVLVVAGLLVGVGTRMGSGCTSGHGVCGVSRLSQRSMIATATFMVAGIATVAVINLIGGL